MNSLPGGPAGQAGAGAAPTAPSPELPKLRGRRVSEICQGFDLDKPEAELVSDLLTPTGFLELLRARESWVTAVTFLSHALPKRESVWWACQCARVGYKDKLSPPLSAMISAGERWVYYPTEENRQAALVAARALRKLNTGAAWAAMSAGYSVIPAQQGDGPPAPPMPNDLTGRAVTASIMFSALELGAPQMPQTLQQFLSFGLDLAAGKPAKRLQ